MKGNRILIVLVLSLFLIPFVYSQDYLSHKVNTDLNLVVSSNNASACNITSIQYPDGTNSLNVYPMAQSGRDFNLTLYKDNFTQFGDICFGVTCTDGVSDEVGSICRTITNNGVVQTTAQGIGSIAYLILMITLTFLFGWMGFKFSESEKLWVLGILLLFFSLLFIIYDVWLGYEYHVNYTGSSNSGVPETMFWIFMFILVAGFLVSGALLFTHWEKMFKYFKKEIKAAKQQKLEDEIDRTFDDML